MGVHIDDEILGESDISMYLPYDENTEKFVAWSKYRMDIIREFGIVEIQTENGDEP